MILKSLYNVKVLWESATKFEKITHSDLRFTFQMRKKLLFYFNRSTTFWGDVLWSGDSGLWACILRMPMSRSDLDLIFFLRGLGEHSITTCTRIHSNDWVKFGPISLGIFKSLTVLSNWKIDGRHKIFWLFRSKSL